MLASGKLAAALTAREFSDRVLGRSEQVASPVRCVWVATANNPALSSEIARRCIRIRIDPRVDEPWKREGFKHPKLRSWVEENRGELIWAALVLCRYGLAHGAAGRPLGSYESWSDILGRILNGCGISGFLGNLDLLYARADAEGTAWRALVAAWWQDHLSTPVSASELYPLIAEVEADLLVNGRDEVGRKKSFGKALARVLDRVFSTETTAGPIRLQITEDGVRHKAKLWKLVPVEGGGIGALGGLFQPHARESTSSITMTEINPQNTHNSPTLPAYAMWHNGEYDEPVTVTGVLGEQDSMVYYAIDGSQTGIPANQVEFFETEKVTPA
jgi:putative DNA primase/helicase